MIRRHENPLAIKAGLLALLVHALFFMLLVMSFNWRSVEPLQLDDVELWDSLPAPAVTPQSQPTPPAPEEKPASKVVEREKPPEPQPETKADIELKNKKLEPKKPEPKKPEPKKVEKPRPDPMLKAREEEKKKADDFKKLQQEMLNDDPTQADLKREAQQLAAERKAEDARNKLAATSKGIIDEWRGKVMRQIYSRMSRQPCGNAVPVYKISLLPSGELAAKPKLVTSSGIAACDDAAARAILQAEPFPLPTEKELFSEIRDLNIPFTPDMPKP